jgi:hypothetical protein
MLQMTSISKWVLPAVLLGLAVANANSSGKSARGPFSPEKLPPTIDMTKKVHFVSIDNTFVSPGPDWSNNLKILTGGDHNTEPVTVGGHTGMCVTGIKFNTADDQFTLWANEHTIDILMQIYGDSALVNPDETPRYFNFLTGTLPDPIAVDSGGIPVGAHNNQWNWVLFRIPNGLRHMDGGRLVGTINPHAQERPEIAAVSRLSGQNGGTIRMDGLHDLKVRFVAFGQRGAFGEPEQINRFKK